jgi:hypothetical protein
MSFSLENATCPSCGRSLSPGTTYCPSCGDAVSYGTNDPTIPSKYPYPPTNYGGVKNPYETEAPIPPPPPKRRKVWLWLVPVVLVVLIAVYGGIRGLVSSPGNHTANVPATPQFQVTTTAPTPVSTPTPKITLVSPITPAQYQTIIITGSGFGTQQPFTNTTSSYLRLQDETSIWDAGYQHDIVGVTVSAWTDNRIEITGFSNYGGSWTFRLGDQVVISVWNPQTHVGPTLFTTTVTD